MKMIVSDYDGTFHINDEDIVKNIEAVDDFMKHGIFVMATGRSYKDFLKQKEKYGLCYNYLVLDHGATILKDDEVLYTCSMDDSLKDELLSSLELDQVVNSFCCSQKESRLDFTASHLTKIHVQYPTKEITKRVFDRIMKQYAGLINAYFIRQYQALEIVSSKVNKAYAIEFIRAREHVDISQVYAIGDNYTDMEMIKTFHGGIMKNTRIKPEEISVQSYDSVSEFIRGADND